MAEPSGVEYMRAFEETAVLTGLTYQKVQEVLIVFTDRLKAADEAATRSVAHGTVIAKAPDQVQ